MPPPEPRQRWRFVVARDADAPMLPQRELTDGWTEAIESAGLPLSRVEGARPRPRISFGAPLPVGMRADRELIDIVLTERWPAWRVREALAASIPPGWRLIEVEDVWLGGPPLPGRVAAADYRITLDGKVAPHAVGEAARGLLAADRLPRERAKGGSTMPYDLRPLLIDVRVADPGPPIVIATRTRFHPELGSGRPEEVVAALADRIGTPLTIAHIVRERLILADDLG